MSSRPTNLTPELYDYVLAHTLRDHPVLAELRHVTASHPRSSMQISPDEGQFLQFLVKLTGARRILEVGCFTGYSSLAMALALPPGGRIVTCDVSEEYTRIAREYWKKAHVEDRIELRLGPADRTLAELIPEGRGQWDLAFLDADKTGYDVYFEQCLELLRPGGLIAIDNVLWSGRVADPAVKDEDTVALRTLNARLHHDERIDLTLVPIADGVTLARKR